MNLSAHFTLAELCKSETASRLSIDNTPDETEVDALTYLAWWIRSHVDYDQLILEYYNLNEPSSGWVHISVVNSAEGKNNRHETLVYDGDSYSQGLPG